MFAALFLLITPSAFASDQTLDFGQEILVSVGSSSVTHQGAEQNCFNADRTIKERFAVLAIEMPGVNFSKDVGYVAAVGSRLIPGDRHDRIEYYCAVEFRSYRADLAFRLAKFKQKQDEACDATFSELYSGKHLIMSEKSAHRTVFKHRNVCRAEYLEIVQK